ncbi:hypothetical protein J6590_029472 [Homalodisca vitripennis]|nr:hypothetical protein J6590_029472 [Homalodisca vitripennis]
MLIQKVVSVILQDSKVTFPAACVPKTTTTVAHPRLTCNTHFGDLSEASWPLTHQWSLTLLSSHKSLSLAPTNEAIPMYTGDARTRLSSADPSDIQLYVHVLEMRESMLGGDRLMDDSSPFPRSPGPLGQSGDKVAYSVNLWRSNDESQISTPEHELDVHWKDH